MITRRCGWLALMTVLAAGAWVHGIWNSDAGSVSAQSLPAMSRYVALREEWGRLTDDLRRRTTTPTWQPEDADLDPVEERFSQLSANTDRLSQDPTLPGNYCRTRLAGARQQALELLIMARRRRQALASASGTDDGVAGATAADGRRAYFDAAGVRGLVPVASPPAIAPAVIPGEETVAPAVTPPGSVPRGPPVAPSSVPAGPAPRPPLTSGAPQAVVRPPQPDPLVREPTPLPLPMPGVPAGRPAGAPAPNVPPGGAIRPQPIPPPSVPRPVGVAVPGGGADRPPEARVAAPAGPVGPDRPASLGVAVTNRPGAAAGGTAVSSGDSGPSARGDGLTVDPSVTVVGAPLPAPSGGVAPVSAPSPVVVSPAPAVASVAMPGPMVPSVVPTGSSVGVATGSGVQAGAPGSVAVVNPPVSVTPAITPRSPDGGPAGVITRPGPAMRPVAVMIENHSASRPHTGLEEAEVLYEMPVEGGITRFMAIYYHMMGDLGPIRSCRPYFPERALEVDAVYAHCGSSQEGYHILNKLKIPSIDEIAHSEPFYRDKTRKAPHNLFCKMPKLVDRFRDTLKVPMTVDPVKLPWRIGPVPTAFTTFNRSVGIRYHGNYQLELRYNPRGLAYERYMNQVHHLDRVSGKPVRAAVVVIQEAPMRVLDDAGRLEVKFVGTGRAYYLADGAIGTGRWSKSAPADRTIFTDQSGNEIIFPEGRPVHVQVVGPQHRLTFDPPLATVTAGLTPVLSTAGAH